MIKLTVKTKEAQVKLLKVKDYSSVNITTSDVTISSKFDGFVSKAEYANKTDDTSIKLEFTKNEVKNFVDKVKSTVKSVDVQAVIEMANSVKETKEALEEAGIDFNKIIESLTSKPAVAVDANPTSYEEMAKRVEEGRIRTEKLQQEARERFEKAIAAHEDRQKSIDCEIDDEEDFS